MDLQFIIDNVNTSILVLISSLVILWVVYWVILVVKGIKTLLSSQFNDKKRYDDLSYETVKKQLEKNDSVEDTEEKKKS